MRGLGQVRHHHPRRVGGKDVELQVAEGRLQIKSGRSTYRAQIFPEIEYPHMPSMPADVIGTVEHDHIGEALRIVEHATARESTFAAPAELVALYGVHFLIHEGTFWVEATDRHRMAHASLPFKGEATELDLTAPLVPLQNALKGLRGTVTIAATEGLVGFSDGQRSVTMRRIETSFPAVNQVFNHKYTATLECDTTELADAIKRALLVVDETARVDLVTLDITPGQIALSAAGSNFDGAEFVEADCDFRVQRQLQRLLHRSHPCRHHQRPRPVPVQPEDPEARTSRHRTGPRRHLRVRRDAEEERMSTLPPSSESLTLLDATDTQIDRPADPIHGMGYQGTSPAARVVRNWHNETHPGAFSTCDLQPCDAVRRVES